MSLFRAPSITTFAAIAASAAIGCSADFGQDADNVSGSSVHLETVPNDVACISVAADGPSGVVHRVFDVAAGQEDVRLDLGTLPLGEIRIDGRAYAGSCTADRQAPDAEPNWIADAQQVEIFAGLPAQIGLAFRRYEPGSGTAEFLESVVSVEVGNLTSYAIAPNGDVYGWGSSAYGLLGSSPTANTASPQRIETLTDIVQVAAGSYHACALDGTGVVSCWGANFFGQLGDNTTAQRSTPAPVVNLPTDIVSVSAGDAHSCALTSDLKLWCWGYNHRGQLGDGSTTQRSDALTATQVPFSKAATGGAHTCGLATTGTIMCTGENGTGQLGTGNATSSTRMLPSRAGTGFVDLTSGSNHTCAIRADGLARCWGSNASGPLGDGTTTTRSEPIDVALSAPATRIDAGRYTTCAVLGDGTVACWGANTSGTVGDGTGINRSTPTTVPGLTDVVDISLGGSGACAVTQEGRLFCWGKRSGDGTTLNRFLPVEITL